MTVTGWELTLAALGALAGPRIRALILRHGVARGALPRLGCPHCLCELLPTGWRGLAATLPSSGRCPGCRARIGPSAGAVEVATASLFVALGLRAGPLPVLAGCWLVAAGVALSVVDVAVYRLPDAITLPTAGGVLAVLAVAAVVGGDTDQLLRAVAGSLALAGFHLLLVVVRPAGLGLGDCKLALAIGAALGWLGWPSLFVAGFVAFALAAGYGVALLLLRRATHDDAIPFGPFQLVGALAVVMASGAAP